MIFVKQNKNNKRNDFWIAFSDLMTGLMLVFIILAITFISISLKDKEQVEELLKESESRKKQVEELLKKIKEDRERLEKSKKNIIVILSNQLSSNNIEIEYNLEKGTVTIAQDILFVQRKANLNVEGQEFITLFSNILDKNIFSNKEYSKLIKYVHIEGYASNEGSDEYNFNLSFNRAKNVWYYMTNSNILNKHIMKNKLNIVSRGEIEANQKIIDEKDRKVVFRFEFYDTYNKIFEGLSK